ncbi:hypothetical protein [Actinomycetospora aeridis]|uniref:EthD domain-containing protein n=1 Tax=Actinomycetospora aeridis TaxID=3129231 RepID=A0ABU8ND54_9PSEU
MPPTFTERNLFFAWSTYTGDYETYAHWYDVEHIPQVMDTTGMVGAQRFLLGDTKNLPGVVPVDLGHLALYEIEGSSAGFREEVKQMLMSGAMVLPDFMNQPFDALFLAPVSEPQYGASWDKADDSTALDDRHLFFAWCKPAADAVADGTFARWYDGEHIPQILGATGMLRAQRFESSPVKPLPGVRVPDLGHLALYEIAGDPSAFREEIKQMLISGEMSIPDFMNPPFSSMFMRPASPFHAAT